MARIVVTGAAGFIGSHLCEALLDRGDAVVAIDNLRTGAMGNIAHLRDRDFEFIRHDVTRYIDVEGTVDYILHFASPASPVDYLEIPIQTLKVGLARHAQRARAGQGQGREVPARLHVGGLRRPAGPPAGRIVLGQRQPDRAARRVRRGQALCGGDHARLPPLSRARYAHRPHLQHLRPRMRLHDGRAVPAFMSQALRDEDVTIFGDGSQTRSFQFISGPGGRHPEVDGARPTTGQHRQPARGVDREIAEIIVRLVNSKSKLVIRPLPVDDPKQRQPDITRARTLLGWEPKGGLEEGLKKTVGYFREKVEAGSKSLEP
jgi:dTDP-glucose 4,6-dehydratase